MLNQDPGTGANPAISVVCSCYNHGRFIGAFLEAMAAQTDGRFEVIIIDDASGDDSLAVIKACHDPRIKLVARERNRGYCASLNDGIRLARADVVAFLASDDLFTPATSSACSPPSGRILPRRPSTSNWSGCPRRASP